MLALALVFTLNACGEGGKDGEASPKNQATAESGKKSSAEDELIQLKKLYDGKWINQDPYDSPFNMGLVSTTGIKITYEASGSKIIDMFYSAGDLTSISVRLSGMSLGKYSIDTKTGILTHKPNDTNSYTYIKE